MEPHYLGIDVGSVTLKTALLDKNGNILQFDYRKHLGLPFLSLSAVLQGLGDMHHSAENPIFAAVTGSGRAIAASALEIASVNEIVAQATAAYNLRPDVRTIIEIGGQDSKFIAIAPDVKEGFRIQAQRMNDICAAGTGAFIEQQAERMNITIEQFCDLATSSLKPSSVAGRCAVFSKSDIVHLQQSGVSQNDIAAGVCDAIVRNYLSAFVKGKHLSSPISLQGGIALNKAVVAAFRRSLKMNENDLFVLQHHAITGAIGAALVAMKQPEKHTTLRKLHVLSQSTHPAKEKSTVVSALSPLGNSRAREGAISNTMLVRTESPAVLYMGIDVGSTSTCVAILDESKNFLVGSYVFNDGNLLGSVDSAITKSIQLLDWKTGISFKRVGITGSGRSLVSTIIGCDIVKDEITAQLAAAIHMHPNVDTIIEIGGQDSKFIRVKNGRLVEFEMNKVCAAGTGSFLQEQAGRLGVQLEHFSELALRSKSPCDLGTRCTVFMESDIITFQQQGIPKEDIIAGLSYAVANNYLEKTVNGKPIGQEIVFLGGVALNRSVVFAFEKLLNKPVVTPPNHHLSAAIGMALFSIGLPHPDASVTKYRGFEGVRDSIQVSEHTCAKCENACRISSVEVGSKVTTYGGLCEHSGTKEPLPQSDLFNRRDALLFEAHKKSLHSTGETVGIPLCHLTWELLPLYSTFLSSLGFRVVLSDRTDATIVSKGVEISSIDNCFPCKTTYGHVQSLADKSVGKIFFPSVSEFARRVSDLKRNHTCPHIQAMPELLKNAFPGIEFVIPFIYRDKNDADWKNEFRRIGLGLGRQAAQVNRAIADAEAAQRRFYKSCESLGAAVLNRSPQEERATCVIFGKSYNVCDKSLNLSIVSKLKKHGVEAIPFDCLPLSTVHLESNYSDMVWECGQELLRAAVLTASKPNLFPIVITNFGCGPDSFILKYLTEIFTQKPMLTLEVDEHTSDIGFVTRIEAFLNNISPAPVRGASDIAKSFSTFIANRKYKHLDKLLYVPLGFESYRAIAAAFESIGIKTKMLPPHNEETERLGRRFSSGRECLPYIMHTGDAVRMTMDADFNPDRVALYMPASDLACRVSLFTTSISLVLKQNGFPQIPIIAPRLSMDKDEVVKVFGIKFAKNAFCGMLGVELLTMMAPYFRPYETCPGSTDLALRSSIDDICVSIHRDGFFGALQRSADRFKSLAIHRSPKPVIGLVGDDYTRGNDYANGDFIKLIESMNAEVRVVPIWSTFMLFQMHRKPEKTLHRRAYAEYLADYIKLRIGEADIREMTRIVAGIFPYFPGLGYDSILVKASPYLSRRSEPLTIIALSHALSLLYEGVDGIVNLVGFQCMIHSIVGATLRPILEKSDTPFLSLLFDFQENIHHHNRIEAFMYQVRQRWERTAHE